MAASADLNHFAQLLARELGYAMQPENRARLARVLEERATTATGGDVGSYLRLLARDHEEARAEWQEVVRELSIGESFFFRDVAQFRLLREELLPRLIRLRSAQRALRIWSAGCSTGEEPYSVAILLRELLPPSSGWDVTIIGTDVNDESIAHARRARYSPWSLRGLSDEQREQYFTREVGRFQLRPEYRSMVTFQRSNLVKDRIPSFESGLHGMDLILCRNVFIYFDAATVAEVADKLAHALAPGGFLVTGHAELHGQRVAALHTQFLPGSAVHERPRFDIGQPKHAPLLAAPPPPPRRPPAEAPARPTGEDRVRAAQEAFARADYTTAIEAVDDALDVRPDDEVALRLAAVAAANLGDDARATAYCRRILALRPKDIEARFLLAKLAEDRGHEDAARATLDEIIGDAPSFVPAYLDLAWLEQRRGDAARAANLREEALRLLDRLPAKTILGGYEGITVEDLRAQLLPRAADAQEGR